MKTIKFINFNIVIILPQDIFTLNSSVNSYMGNVGIAHADVKNIFHNPQLGLNKRYQEYHMLILPILLMIWDIKVFYTHQT